MSSRTWTLLALLAACVAAAAAAPKTLVEAVDEDPKLSELSKILKKNPAVAGIMGEGFTGTLLAPTDSAVRYAKQVGINLTPYLLNFHILPVATRVADMNDGDQLPTLDTHPLTVIYSDSELNLVSSGAAAKLVKTDKAVGNAVLHVIDSVLLPVPQEELAGAEISAAFAAAKTATQAAAVARKDKQAEAAGGGAGAGTVDAASATVGPVVAGGTVDAMAMEGPAPSEGPAMLDQAAPGAVAAAIAGALGSAIEAATLEDALIEANLTALLEDVESLGLLETLQNGAFTIFAPLASVYEAITDADLDAAAKTKVLLSHVVNGTFKGTDLYERLALPTLAGDNVLVERIGDRIFLRAPALKLAEVVGADATGGSTIVHTIDSLLAPLTLAGQPAAPAPLAAPEVATPTAAAVTRSCAAALAAALAVAAAMLA